MNLREKYGEWAVILGATEGVGKAFCEKVAAGGMSVEDALAACVATSNAAMQG